MIEVDEERAQRRILVRRILELTAHAQRIGGRGAGVLRARATSLPARSECSNDPALTQYSLAESMFMIFGQSPAAVHRTSRPSVFPVNGSVSVVYENGNGASG